ncbi:pilus assembly FimT family protein [Vibrio intestinalis]|uniref:pilus assembly FimT family protein n=1 Tax=Vibrio intestinalis TaxID=2933291 RepID=UPI0021A5EA14|nr:type II secretion system protein [Vibrio intestinalis]
MTSHASEKTQPQTGFTLVELIVVILLLSILSAVAVSRFTSKQSFEVFALQELVVSVVRQVQVNRMQSNVDIDAVNNDNFVLAVASDCLGSVAACKDYQLDPNAPARSDRVTPPEYQFSIVGGDTSVSFDLLGNPLMTTLPVEILVTSSVSSEAGKVCINSQGHVTATTGACL